jgi:hypothetical protein
MTNKPKLEPNTFFESHRRLISKAVSKGDQATLISCRQEIDSWNNQQAKAEAMWFLLSEILILTELTRFQNKEDDGTYLKDVLADRFNGVPTTRYTLQELIDNFVSEENAWYYLGINNDSIDEFTRAWQNIPEPEFVQYNHDPSNVTLCQCYSTSSFVRHCLTISSEDIVKTLTNDSYFQHIVKNLTPLEISVKSRDLFDDVAEIVELQVNETFFYDVLKAAIAEVLEEHENIQQANS